jgi:predicted nucleic acid-binding protein
MGSRNRLTDPAPFIADASAVINLNATGHAREILRALPRRVKVVDIVAMELDQGRRRGRDDAGLLDELVEAGLAEIVRLDETAESHFEKLVIGPATVTLDDGEAATIAYAVDTKAIAVIDERKATRLCAQFFPDLQLGCTVDILSHAEVGRHLGKPGLGDAVFAALQRGRMRVLPQHVKWVVELIGPARAAACASLPKSVRQPQQNVSGQEARSKNDAV